MDVFKFLKINSIMTVSDVELVSMNDSWRLRCRWFMANSNRRASGKKPQSVVYNRWQEVETTVYDADWC